MKQLHSPLPIFRVQVAELKGRLLGGAPQSWARLVLTTDEGVTVADTSFNALSEQSWELLRKLCSSIEEDYVKTLESKDFSQWGSGEEAKEEGINFDDDNKTPWGM